MRLKLIKMQMLWNWYTIDACFLSSTWHIKSSGMFAGSCIGVICLVMSLEFLRRLNKEYDRYLISKRATSRCAGIINDAIDKTGDQPSPISSTRDPNDNTVAPGSGSYMPSIMEQAIRALSHMLQFAVAYFIMLYVPTHEVLMPTTEHGLTAGLHQQACHVLQRLHHNLHLHRRLSGCLRFPLGSPWTTVGLQ